MPSEPSESNLRKSIHLKSYPIHEVSGMIWAYLGPEEEKPPFPEFYWMKLKPNQLVAERVWQECNYLQVLENDLDFVHAAFLHKAHGKQEVNKGLLSSDLGVDPTHPLIKSPPVKQDVESTNYGKRCIAVGKGDELNQAFMEIHFIFPFYTFPPRFDEEDGMWHAFIPRDDHSTWSWDVQFSHASPIDARGQHERRGLTLDENLRKFRNKDNHYEQDRELMKTGNFTGIRGIATQDHAATETMGPIVDRTKEHLGTSDEPVIHLRRILLANVKAFEEGKNLIKLNNESLKNLYSSGVYAPYDKTWQEALPLKEEYRLKQ